MLGLALGLDVAGDMEPRVAVLRLQDQAVDLISELGARSPTVVVFEDLHWAAEPFVELVSRLLAEATGPVFVLGTTRPGREELPAGDTLDLEPLDDAEARDLIETALAAPLEERARQLVVDRAEGNPFFVEEILAELLDRELLERQNGSWALRPGDTALGLPDSVQGVLAARIDLLPSEAKEALQAAAVIGRSFAPGGLAALVGSAAEVRTLVDRGFVRPTEPELVFRHALTREVAYESLPKARRAQLHAAFAEWLEQQGPGDTGAGSLAYHYAEAVDPSIAGLAWRDDEARERVLRERALTWLRRAAELAIGRFDLDDALANLHRATDLDSGDAALWHSIGRVNALKFDGEAMWPAMERAIELTEEGQELADLYAELAFESSLRGGMWRRPIADALVAGWVDRALELAAPGTRAHARAGVTRAMWEDDAALAEEVVAAAEQLDDPVLLSYACFARSGAAFVTFDYRTAYEWAQRRFALLDRIEDPDKVAHVHFYGAGAALAVGRLEEALARACRHDEIASRLSVHHEVHALGILLFVQEALGRWDDIRRLQPRIERAVAANAGTPCVLNPRNLLSCAVACRELGVEEDERLEADATACGFEGYAWWLGPPATQLALRRGDRRRLDELVKGFRESWSWSMDGSPYAGAVLLEALVELGRDDQAEDVAVALVQPGTYLEPFALRTLGAVRGDRTLVEQAISRFDELGLEWHAARTRTLTRA
jgi:hypothetical protein